MKHNMKLQPKYYDYIKNGSKRIEIRLCDEKRQKILLNDIIIFTKEPLNEESFEARVVGLIHYNSFEEMFKDFPIEMLSDKSMTKEGLIKELEIYYPKELQKQYSVLGIRVKL